jgi:type I restriction enzyme S subunit
MSQTLEAMARALFKAWFVDFDPVRAKRRGDPGGRPRWQRGQSLPGLPAHLYDLFPDRLVDSELGEIPEGWRVAKLGELLELAYGKALKEEDRQDGTIPVYGSNGQVGWHNEKLVTGPGIIVGRKGNPGVVKWVPTDFFPIDTTFYVVPKDKCPSLSFLFYALERQDLASLSADSAVPGLNRNLAYMSSQILPPRTVLVAFDSAVQPLFQRTYESERESRTLAALRDALLPKLIRGEIRVRDAERFLMERGL